MRRLMVLSLVVTFALAFPLLLVAGANPATGAVSTSVACGDTITSDTTLTSDLTDCPGNGLIIGADNITLDCAGHTIDGDDSGGDSGISVGGRSWDTIENCVVTDFTLGVDLYYSSDNTLTNNTANSNTQAGLRLYSSSNNTLTDTTANSNTGNGVYLSASNGNTLTGSTIRDNSGTALTVGGDGNSIYNNYFSNPQNAGSSGSNTWNIAKTPGTNIIGGPYLGGNYWSDYTGADTNGDGLGDTGLPYNSNGNIQNGGDYAPLATPSAPPPCRRDSGTAERGRGTLGGLRLVAP